MNGARAAIVRSAYPREEGRVADWINAKDSTRQVIYIDPLQIGEAVTGNLNPENVNATRNGWRVVPVPGEINGFRSDTWRPTSHSSDKLNLPRFGSEGRRHRIARRRRISACAIRRTIRQPNSRRCYPALPTQCCGLSRTSERRQIPPHHRGRTNNLQSARTIQVRLSALGRWLGRTHDTHSSRAIVICRQTGVIHYDGSAGNEE
jgi:hypothetical protein